MTTVPTTPTMYDDLPADHLLLTCPDHQGTNAGCLRPGCDGDFVVVAPADLEAYQAEVGIRSTEDWLVD